MGSNDKETPDGSDRDYNIYLLGEELDSTEASLLERKIESNANCLTARVKLLCYYCNKFDHREDWVRHVRWMISNHPEHWLTGNLPYPSQFSVKDFESLKSCWLSVVKEHESVGVLNRAAEFIWKRDQETALSLLNKSVELDHCFADANRNLLKVYMMKAEQKEEGFEHYVRLVFEQGERALTYENHAGEQEGLLIKLVNFALKNNELDYAKSCIKSLLKLVTSLNSDRGTAQAYCMLGRLAIRKNRLSVARRCLLKSSDFDFFPSMVLAEELLAIEEGAVLRFLEKCLLSVRKEIAIGERRGYVSPILTERSTRLTRWLDAIRMGEKVDFAQ